MKSFVLMVLVYFGLILGAWGEGFSPRPEGSPAEARQLEGIAGQLRHDDIPYQLVDYAGLSDAHSFAKSLVVNLKGQLSDRLVVVVPVDTSPSHDAKTGLEWALTACRVWKSNLQKVGLTVLFAGAERGTTPDYPLSSRQFLNGFFPSGNCAVLILDVDQPTANLELSLVSGSWISPLWLTQSWLDALRSAGFAVRFAGNQPQIFRFDLPEKRTLAQPWFNRGFPTLLVHNSSGVTADIKNASFTQALKTFTGKFSEGFPASSDKNYLIFDAGFKTIFLPQGAYLFLILGVVAFLIILYFVRERHRGLDVSSWILSTWQIPVVFFFLFIFLSVATSLLLFLFQLRSFPEFWKYEPLITLILKISLGLALYFVFFFQFRRIPLSRWSKFYSYSALLVLSLETLAAAAIELSFSFYFLWALVFALLFHLTNRRWLKVIFFILAPLWFAKAVAEVFWLYPDHILTQLILVSTPLGNLGVALLLYPFLLLAHSFHYQRHQRQQRNEKHRVRVLLLLWSSISVAVSVLVLRINPFQNSVAPLTWSETVNLNQHDDQLTLSAPVPWHQIKVVMPTGIDIPENRQRANLAMPFRNDILSTKLSSRAFLNRTIWSLQILSQGQPSRLQVVLYSQTPMVVYACNFPFRLENGGKRVRIFIGANPPEKLEVSITLTHHVQASLDLDVQYSPSPRKLELKSSEFEALTSLQIHDQLLLDQEHESLLSR